MTVTEYVASRIALRGSGADYWHHLITWWAQRENPDVLLLTYEQMNADPQTHISRVAEFCGIPLDDALLDLTRERASLAFMLAHKDLFDEKMTREKAEQQLGPSSGSDAAKVRAGRVGSYASEMPPEAIAMLDRVWSETVTVETGLGIMTNWRRFCVVRGVGGSIDPLWRMKSVVRELLFHAP